MGEIRTIDEIEALIGCDRHKAFKITKIVESKINDAGKKYYDTEEIIIFKDFINLSKWDLIEKMRDTKKELRECKEKIELIKKTLAKDKNE